MPSFFDLPIELRNRIYDYAIEITPITTTHPWENNGTRIQGYSSLIRVNKQAGDEIQSLHPQNRVLDITLFFDNLPALLSALKASREYRILRDARFRLASVVGEAARLDKRDEDVREFLLALDGFDDEWSPHPIYWR